MTQPDLMGFFSSAAEADAFVFLLSKLFFNLGDKQINRFVKIITPGFGKVAAGLNGELEWKMLEKYNEVTRNTCAAKNSRLEDRVPI